ncbi:lytic polysaccharide monooxygenase [Veronia pacifica]|uniref:Spindolin n=1 Tax=Veronia pacifica TaxID=1080227 RepID=A0A1C3EEQ3_9GAMM|nr:lytic polysaccharide monooxygenase [Veronia pacifica]ODA31699.1 spindolin [Veronia pacifica]
MLRLSSTRLSVIAGSLLTALMSTSAVGHGYMDFPAARQEICDRDSGHWDSDDGSTIPNLACRASFLTSSWTPLVQKHEFAKLITDYDSQSAVELAVPDGLLCSGGDPAKKGMSLPSPDWQKTAIDPAANGKLRLTYRASTPHNPSYWKIYLSNQNFDPAVDELGWSDVELIAEFGNLPLTEINGKKYYQMDVTLPTDRVGDAVLFSRWQRNDAAGEGFYNCSDISFGGVLPPTEWISLGSVVKSSTVAEPGDTVWFRVFNGQGSEQIFEKLPITSSNDDESVWASELAEKVNAEFSDIARLGIKQPDDTVIWDSTDLFSNLVYVNDKAATFQLEVKKPALNAPPVLSGPSSLEVQSGKSLTFTVSATDPDSPSLTFSSDKGTLTASGNTANVSFTAPVTDSDISVGIRVTVSDGELSDSMVVNVNVSGEITDSTWDKDTTYMAGDTVVHKGVTYKAQWWNQGQEPGATEVWVAQGGDKIGEWSASKAYTTGETVTYQGSSYEAKWWTRGDVPSAGGPWKRQ